MIIIVSYLYITVLIQQHIFQFQIPMHHTIL